MALRLFAAIALDEAAREQIAAALPRDGRTPKGAPPVRWLAPHNWHLTLQFFGRVEEAALPDVRAACERAARATAPFVLELGGAGAFPSPRRARVVWIGVRSGHERVAALAEALFARTEPLGFPREQREFRSHLTVARLKTPDDVAKLLAALHVPSIVQQVGELTLYRSQLSSRGAEYEPLARFPLG